MSAQGVLVAIDSSANRLRALKQRADELGVRGMMKIGPSDLRAFSEAAVRAQQQQQQQEQDGSSGAANGSMGTALMAGGLPVQYDRVLLDAPCSGTGVLAKRADLRWRRTPEQLQELVELQGQLLQAAAPLVRLGGLLVYATCSIEPEENWEQVQAFLGSEAGAQFVVEPPPPGLLPEAVLSAQGCMETLPHVVGLDGAFAARLRRANATGS